MKRLTKLITDKFVYFPVLLLGALPWVWLKTEGTLINGVDTNFPLDPSSWFLKRFYIWNDDINAGFDWSSSVAGIFFHFLQYLSWQIFHDLQTVEKITLSFWIMAVAVAIIFFLRTISIKKVPAYAICAGLAFYFFNPYVFNSFENVKVSNISLLFGLPFFLTVYINTFRRRYTFSKAAVMTAIGSIIASGSGINPAYFLVIILSLVLLSFFYYLKVKESTYRKYILRISFILTSLIFLINAFWIFPMVRLLLAKSQTAGTGIESLNIVNWLSGLSEHTSILNVLRVMGAWDWYVFTKIGESYYVPYSHDYVFNPLYVLYSFLPIFITLVSLLVIRQKFIKFFLFSILVLGAFLAAGSHTPTGSLYIFLAKHVPFFSFFRSPWYIFTPLILVSTAGLIALFFDWLGNTNKRAMSAHYKSIALVSSTLFILYAVFYGNPILTGEIYRPNFKNGSFYINFPDYVFESKKWLDSTNPEHRILSLPGDPIERFTWGYSGIDSILGLLSDNNVILSSFGTLNKDVYDVTRDRLYGQIYTNKIEQASKILASLNANYMFYKTDSADYPKSLYAQDLDKSFALDQSKTIGKWQFVPLKDNLSWPLIFTTNQFNSLTGDKYSLAEAIESNESHNPSVYIFNENIGEDMQPLISRQYIKPINKVLEEVDLKAKTLQWQPSSVANIDTIVDNKAKYTFTLNEEVEVSPLLENRGLESFGIDTSQPLAVTIDDLPHILVPLKEVTGWIEYSPISLKKGNHTLYINIPVKKNMVESGDFETTSWVGSTNGLKDADSANGRYSMRVEGNMKQEYVQSKINGFDSMAYYQVSLYFKHGLGKPPAVGIRQDTDKEQDFWGKELTTTRDWNSFSFTYIPDNKATEALLRFYANEHEFSKTFNFYDDVQINRLFTNTLLFRVDKPSENISPQVSYEKVNPTKYKVTVSGSDQPFILYFGEKYSNDWSISSENKLDAMHFVANGWANGWKINNLEDKELVIEYLPQRSFVLSSYISIFTVLIVFIYALFHKMKKGRV